MKERHKRSRRKRNLDRLIRGLQRRGWKVERLPVKMNGNPANLANGSVRFENERILREDYI